MPSAPPDWSAHCWALTPTWPVSALHARREPSTSLTVLPRSAATSSAMRRLLQRVDRGSHEVDRGARAEALAQDVLDAAELEHGAHAGTGDDAGTLAGRLEEHATGTDVTRRRRAGWCRRPWGS